RPEATDWLWHHRIPRGAQTISTGWPGVGKSQQQCDIVAHTSTGTPWPDNSMCPCGDTVMLTCEDSYAKDSRPPTDGGRRQSGTSPCVANHPDRCSDQTRLF